MWENLCICIGYNFFWKVPMLLQFEVSWSNIFFLTVFELLIHFKLIFVSSVAFSSFSSRGVWVSQFSLDSKIVPGISYLFDISKCWFPNQCTITFLPIGSSSEKAIFSETTFSIKLRLIFFVLLYFSNYLTSKWKFFKFLVTFVL